MGTFQHVLEQSVEVSFYSPNGNKCAAKIYYPDEGALRKYPVILMLNGWGGTQDLLTLPFVEAFMQIGYAVMTFDYSTWGRSQGIPRNQISPWLRVREAEQAIQYLQRLEEIDANKIVIWGTSFGGGHVIDLAAKYPNLLGAIAHVPMLDGVRAVLANSVKDMLKIGLKVIQDYLPSQSRTYIPVIAPTHQFATMNRDQAYDFLVKNYNELGTSIDDYDNRVTARSVITIGMYRPIRHLKTIQIPTLLIGAIRDSVAPFDLEKIKKINNPHIEYQLLDANHFEPYFEPSFQQNIQYQLEFLKKLICD
ncbi:alpha/beta hydrolase [Acinetobacter sp. 3657]|uniref:alpha/beta hydrolase n=1 Tax=Acinetobacter sp. 3657 TaxID=2817764 RepID=UPI00285AE0E6|nr:pimeloyl-ACP methyl ester carboxylesterase [Prolinoborus sp. 3657]